MSSTVSGRKNENPRGCDQELYTPSRVILSGRKVTFDGGSPQRGIPQRQSTPGPKLEDLGLPPFSLPETSVGGQQVSPSLYRRSQTPPAVLGEGIHVISSSSSESSSHHSTSYSSCEEIDGLPILHLPQASCSYSSDTCSISPPGSGSESLMPLAKALFLDVESVHTPRGATRLQHSIGEKLNKRQDLMRRSNPLILESRIRQCFRSACQQTVRKEGRVVESAAKKHLKQAVRSELFHSLLHSIKILKAHVAADCQEEAPTDWINRFWSVLSPVSQAKHVEGLLRSKALDDEMRGLLVNVIGGPSVERLVARYSGSQYGKTAKELLRLFVQFQHEIAVTGGSWRAAEAPKEIVRMFVPSGDLILNLWVNGEKIVMPEESAIENLPEREWAFLTLVLAKLFPKLWVEALVNKLLIPLPEEADGADEQTYRRVLSEEAVKLSAGEPSSFTGFFQMLFNSGADLFGGACSSEDLRFYEQLLLVLFPKAWWIRGLQEINLAEEAGKLFAGQLSYFTEFFFWFSPGPAVDLESRLKERFPDVYKASLILLKKRIFFEQFLSGLLSKGWAPGFDSIKPVEEARKLAAEQPSYFTPFFESCTFGPVVNFENKFRETFPDLFDRSRFTTEKASCNGDDPTAGITMKFDFSDGMAWVYREFNYSIRPHDAPVDLRTGRQLEAAKLFVRQKLRIGDAGEVVKSSIEVTDRLFMPGVSKEDKKAIEKATSALLS